MKGKMNRAKQYLCILLALFLGMTGIPFSQIQGNAAEETREYTIKATSVTGAQDVFAYYPSGGWKQGVQLEEYFTKDPVETQAAGGTAASDIYYTVKFSGTGVALYGYQAPAHGENLKVFVDGAEKGSFNGYAAARTSTDVLLWQTAGLENGTHVLKVQADGTKAAAATGSHIEVTKAVVTVPVIRVPAEDVVFAEEESFVRVGETLTLGYHFVPENAERPADLMFRSADETIASVSAGGEVRGKKSGVTEIEVSSADRGFSRRLKLNVLEEKTEIEAFYVDSGDQYQQKAYAQLLRGQKKFSEQTWTWKNDKAVSEIAVLSKTKALQNVSVSVTDLKAEAAVIPASAVTLSFVKEVRAFIGHAGWYSNNTTGAMPSGPRENYPEVIDSGEPVSMAAGQLQLVWAETMVPEDAPAGIYKGTITVSAENTEETIELVYAVEVMDAVQPDPQDYDFDVEYWSHPYNVAYYYQVTPFSDEHLELLKQHMELYKSLGGHAVTASIVEEAWGGQTYGGGNEIHYPSMIKWIKQADGTWEFDYTDFDKWVSLNKEIGIADKIICYSMMPWNAKVKYLDQASGQYKEANADPANMAQYNAVWTPFLTDFVAHLDEKGWFDTTYMGFDERHNMGTAFDLIDSITNQDGKALKKSAAFNDFRSNADIFGRLDYASVGLQQIRDNLAPFQEQVAARRRNNQDTTMYTATEHVPNSFTKSNPVESYWTILYAGSLNTTGFLRWAYDAWVEDPLTESTHSSFPAGDCFLVYPSKRDAEVKESKFSVRLAKLDEGVRDINKLYQMRKASDGLEAKVSALLDGIQGDRITDYAYSTLAPSDSWGRTAKWLTEAGKNAMLSDMAVVKRGIYEITKAYIAEQKPHVIQDIAVQKPEKTELAIGETMQLTFAVQPSSANGAEVIWSSSDPDVAAVDPNGVVTMKKPGTVVITASSAENKNICEKIELHAYLPQEKQALAEKISAVQALKQADYTAESWKAAETALQAANGILGKYGASEKEIAEALDVLAKAVANLKKAETEPPVSPPISQQVLTAGKIYAVGAFQYRILSVNPAKASLVGGTNKNLKSLTVPLQVTICGQKVNVTQIGGKAFKGCKKLKRVTVGANVEWIGGQAFAGCKKLNKVVFKGKKAPKIKRKAFKGTAKKLKVTAKKMKKKQQNQVKKRMRSAGARLKK